MNIPAQIRNNLVALISLCVAVFSVSRAGAIIASRHRNIRVAGFDVLKNLGELQTIATTPIKKIASPPIHHGMGTREESAKLVNDEIAATGKSVSWRCESLNNLVASG